MTLTSEVFIQATETDPAAQARTVIRTGQQRLLAALRPKVALLTELELGADAREAALATLTDFCAGPVRRHLNATDLTLYAPAAGSPETRLLIRALRAAATALEQDIDALTRTDDTHRTKVIAQSIEAHLTTHLAVEQTVLLPALASLFGGELTILAADFTILLDGGRLDQSVMLDVTGTPHGQRHPQVFARYGRLAPGEVFTLVDNHDPEPLRHEFEATHPGAFTWDYLQTGPLQWQVRIGRVAPDD
ncbi:DUF2249 domain-containing protein [Streptomyces sp. NPDC005202]|uniref:DUF2249 domain-containing protein n=1 Tax=Streptomyces sp. NPDC005202 TaxID=3157021 RepID=UPI0033A7C65D